MAFRPSRQIGVGSVNISDLEKQYVMEVLNANRLSAGPFMARFEAEFARAHGSQFGVMCNSGTSALQIALATLKAEGGWADGDEVIVPAVTFIATSNIVLYNGLKPMFVDVDPVYYNIDPAKIEAKITPRTRAIIPVHLFGLPCDMDPILEISERHELKVLEDSCETMFARYKGKPVGSFGEIACFSTFSAHILVTGVGGIAVTQNPAYAIAMKSFMSHGRDSIYLNIEDDQVTDPEKLYKIVSSRFSFVRLGHSFRATEMEAALGLGQLSRKGQILKKRRENAQFLSSALEELEPGLQLPKAPPHSEHAFMVYPILINDAGIDREELVRNLEENLIETRYMLPLLNQPIYQKLFGDLERDYPVARKINRQGIYIGCHPELTADELDYMASTIKAFAKERGKEFRI